MKTHIIALLFICVSCSLMQAQRIVENPAFEVRNSSISTITKIELSTKETRVYIHCSFKPGWWVKYNKDQYLQDVATGEKYYPTAIEGTEFGKETYMPESGKKDFVVVFPPLPDGIEKLNWREDDSYIWGISLKNEKTESKEKVPFLKNIEGNWLLLDGSNAWTYGFYPDFVIFDSKFWSYESVQEKKNKIAISLKSDDGKNKKIELRLQKTGMLSVLEKGKEPLSLSREKISVQGFNDPLDKDFDRIFHTDTACLRGYLKGYDSRLGFTNGIIYLENCITRETYPTVVSILPDGRFEADFELNFPVMTHVVFNDNWIPFFIEPGETLMLYLDWDDLLEKDRLRDRFMLLGHTLAMGALGKTNDNLNSVKMLKLNYSEFEKQFKTLTPEDFYPIKIKQLEEELEKLEKAFAANYFTAKAKHLLLNETKLNIGEILFTFLMYRNFEARSDKDNPVLKIAADNTYYRFLPSMPMDDSVSVCCNSYSSFLNRYEYNDIFNSTFNKKVFVTKAPGENELSLLNRYADYYLKEWQLKDSVLNDVLHLEPTLTHNIAKVRGLHNPIPYLYSSRDVVNRFTNEMCRTIKEPVLKEAVRKLADKLAPEEKVESYELRPSKGTDIFRGIIDPFKGKYLFVDFWAIGCGPCRSGIEGSAGLREKYKDSPDFKFVYITDDKGSPLDAYNKYIEKNLKGETSYRLSENDYNYLRELFKFSGIPHYIMVDREGRILTEDFYMSTLENRLKTLLMK